MTEPTGTPRTWRVTASGEFDLDGRTIRAALGKGGVTSASEKREGDGATPLGAWPVRRALYRPDRVDRPSTRLPLQPIGPEDGWCDAPGDPAYNRPVRRPYPASHEKMRRDDALYDLVVVLGHNDDPPVAPMGSAIFLHCCKGDYEPTLGCVAIDRADLVEFLAKARPGDLIEIVRD